VLGQQRSDVRDDWDVGAADALPLAHADVHERRVHVIRRQFRP
jgi:hypothetical protein